MVYVDISALVALFTNEATAERIANWVAEETRPLVSGDWCMTEFASALALKQRASQITSRQCGVENIRPILRETSPLVAVGSGYIRPGCASGAQLQKWFACRGCLASGACVACESGGIFSLDVRLSESA